MVDPSFRSQSRLAKQRLVFTSDSREKLCWRLAVPPWDALRRVALVCGLFDLVESKMTEGRSL